VTGTYSALRCCAQSTGISFVVGIEYDGSGDGGPVTSGELRNDAVSAARSVLAIIEEKNRDA
jgi:hypothetical protein